jgi:hypothetical protein
MEILYESRIETPLNVLDVIVREVSWKSGHGAKATGATGGSHASPRADHFRGTRAVQRHR